MKKYLLGVISTLALLATIALAQSVPVGTDGDDYTFSTQHITDIAAAVVATIQAQLDAIESASTYNDHYQVGSPTTVIANSCTSNGQVIGVVTVAEAGYYLMPGLIEFHNTDGTFDERAAQVMIKSKKVGQGSFSVLAQANTQLVDNTASKEYVSAPILWVGAVDAGEQISLNMACTTTGTTTGKVQGRKGHLQLIEIQAPAP